MSCMQELIHYFKKKDKHYSSIDKITLHFTGVDIDFQDSYIVSVNFAVIDEESGIQSCSWGIGKRYI